MDREFSKHNVAMQVSKGSMSKMSTTTHKDATVKYAVNIIPWILPKITYTKSLKALYEPSKSTTNLNGCRRFQASLQPRCRCNCKRCVGGGKRTHSNTRNLYYIPWRRAPLMSTMNNPLCTIMPRQMTNIYTFKPKLFNLGMSFISLQPAGVMNKQHLGNRMQQASWVFGNNRIPYGNLNSPFRLHQRKQSVLPVKPMANANCNTTNIINGPSSLSTITATSLPNAKSKPKHIQTPRTVTPSKTQHHNNISDQLLNRIDSVTSFKNSKGCRIRNSIEDIRYFQRRRQEQLQESILNFKRNELQDAKPYNEPQTVAYPTSSPTQNGVVLEQRFKTNWLINKSNKFTQLSKTFVRQKKKSTSFLNLKTFESKSNEVITGTKFWNKDRLKPKK